MGSIGKFSIALGLAFLLLSGCSSVTKNSKEVITLVSDEKYQEAEKIIVELDNSETLKKEEIEEIKKNIETELLSEMSAVIEGFEKDEVTVHKINEILNGYIFLNIEGLSTKVREYKVSLRSLINSRESFEKGEGYLTNGEYKIAIDKFEEVIEEDVKFQQAQENIIEAKSNLLAFIKQEVDKKEQDGGGANKYSEIFDYIKKYEKYFIGDETFKSLLNKHEIVYYNEGIKYVNELRTKNEYEKAINELEKMNSVTSTEEIKNLLTEIKDDQEKEFKKKREALLANMSKHYDSMTDITRIAPKGINPFNLNIPKDGFIFFPMIQLSGQDMDSGVVAISIVGGFSQDDWVFMDRVLFNLDGERFNWEFRYGDVNREVNYGIYEWFIKTNISDSNLKDDLQRIASAKTATIRFVGDTNSRDVTLSTKQIQQIKEALELYESMNVYGF